MKILIASSIDSDTIKRLQQHHDVVCAFNAKKDVLKERIRDREAIIFRSGVQITAEVMECAPDLKLVIRAGSGIDNLDLEYIHQHGLHLERIPGPGAKAVAEMSFGLMLALSRRLLEADRLTRQGRWAKHKLAGYLLTGKVLGIIGAGNIGSRVGQMGAAWGMNVIGCVENPSLRRANELREKNVLLKDFDTVISTTDFVTIHVPLKDSTRNLINADVLSRMKSGAILINLARGGVVDEAALRVALSEPGRLRGAALDVHAQEGEGKISPLAELSNVILTPHIGATTFDSQREIGCRITEIIEAFEIDSQSKSLKIAVGW